mgnify:FL=1
MKKIYLDNSATTRLDDDVLAKMMPYLQEEYGNASSIYSLGRSARKALEEARGVVASLINCNPNEIYWTSGGSESDNTAIKGIMRANKDKGRHLIVSKIEHPAILESVKALVKEGFEVSYVDVLPDGTVDLDELKSLIRDDTILISVMFANNEIGTIEPIKEIAEIAHAHNIIFHTDAVQAMGAIKIDVASLGIDSLSMSAHKFYGPKGMGALYMKKGIKWTKFVDGGHQEQNKRAGTSNVAGAVGLAAALQEAYDKMDEHNQKLRKLRDFYETEIEKRIPYIKFNGNKENRLPGLSNISFKFIEGEGLLLNLDLKGICASSGSACTSGSLDPSHVLLAIGLPHEIAHGSLRISIGKYNTKEDMDYLITNLEEIVQRLRDMSPLWEEFMEGSDK